MATAKKKVVKKKVVKKVAKKKAAPKKKKQKRTFRCLNSKRENWRQQDIKKLPPIFLFNNEKSSVFMEKRFRKTATSPLLIPENI